MNTILLKVLAVILSGVSSELLDEKVVAFEKMPVECSAVYDADIRKLRNATATKVVTINLNSDKEPELLIFNGESGSGGEGWVVMQKYNNKYRKVGEVFGILHKLGNGFIVESPCGWNEATWSYYTIEHGKIVCKFDIVAKYSKPVRKELVSVKINIKKQK